MHLKMNEKRRHISNLFSVLTVIQFSARYYRSAPLPAALTSSTSSNEMVELLRLLEEKIRELQIIVKRRNA